MLHQQSVKSFTDSELMFIDFKYYHAVLDLVLTNLIQLLLLHEESIWFWLIQVAFGLLLRLLESFNFGL